MGREIMLWPALERGPRQRQSSLKLLVGVTETTDPCNLYVLAFGKLCEQCGAVRWSGVVAG